jgi:hypothetical protein
MNSKQCVFIRGFRAKKHLLQILPTKIMAAAEPKPDNGCSGEEDDDVPIGIEVEDLTDQPEVRIVNILYFALIIVGFA